MRRLRRVGATAVGLATMALVVSGCSKTLVFATATKFGLDISQRADQTIDVSMGYDRYELASIPAKNTDATKTSQKDTYSVLGIFSLSYGNPWSEPLVLRQFFATGWAARHAAENKSFQQFFGNKTGEIILRADREISQQRAKEAQP